MTQTQPCLRRSCSWVGIVTCSTGFLPDFAPARLGELLFCLPRKVGWDNAGIPTRGVEGGSMVPVTMGVFLPGLLPVFAPSRAGESLFCLQQQTNSPGANWDGQRPARRAKSTEGLRKSNQKNAAPTGAVPSATAPCVALPPASMQSCAPRPGRRSLDSASLRWQATRGSKPRPCGLAPPSVPKGGLLLGSSLRAFRQEQPMRTKRMYIIRTGHNEFGCLDVRNPNPRVSAPSIAADGGTGPQGRAMDRARPRRSMDGPFVDPRQRREAQEIGGQSGCLFLWLLSFGQAKESNSPARDGAKTGRRPGRKNPILTGAIEPTSTPPVGIPASSQPTPNRRQKSDSPNRERVKSGRKPGRQKKIALGSGPAGPLGLFHPILRSPRPPKTTPGLTP